MTSIQANGATQTLYIRQITGTTQHSTDQVNWTTISSWPATITNTNATPASNILRVLFTTNLTFNNVSNYFAAGSDGIQFGDTSLNANGTRPVITIAVNDYPGLIRNGTGITNGNANVYIYNLVVDGTGYQTSLGGGWIGQEYYGQGKTNNFIVNCGSYGTITGFGGGIVGQAGGSSGELTIRRCSSYGAVEQYAGGIAGQSAGYLGSITCEQCWSEGAIGSNSGGIFGSYGGKQGYAIATKCYSIGTIGTDGGGIYGDYAGESIGQAMSQNCYSRGSIGTNAGGIFGSSAGAGLAIVVSAVNCYSSGSLGTGAGGIYGASKDPVATTTSCYSANGSWNSTTAQSTLTMTPYISVVANQPFELRDFGPSPYSLRTVVSNDVTITFNQTVVAGSSSSAGLLAGVLSYSILSGSHPTISINSSTGALSTTSVTPVGTYTIIVRADISSYSITTFTLTVTAPSPGRLDLKGKQFDFKTYTNIQEGQRFVIERNGSPNIRFNSFAEYNKYLIANSAFRR